MNSEDLYRKALHLWGYIAQVDLMIEECSELTKALRKWKRGAESVKNTNDIIEELADVEIMLEQLKIMFNYNFQLTTPTSKFEQLKAFKLKRLEKMLE